MFFVYVLLSEATGKLYIGQTQHLEKRLFAHNNGFSRYTKGKGPWKIVYKEQYETRKEAILRERFLKSGKGREYLKSKLAC